MTLFEGPRPCPGCHRARNVCWRMPCLYLEFVIARGIKSIESWIRAGVPAEFRAGVRVEKRA